MEALKLATIDDLMLSADDQADDQLELISGEIVRRPMTRAFHARAQGNTREELGPFNRRSGPDGWWILTEASVAYEPHECPAHDLAGWRKARLPCLPSGLIDLPPDWVCEIISPGHERKDTQQIPLLLQRHQVPYYWLIWPEDGKLVAHQLEAGRYRVIATVDQHRRARIPPFDEIELDLSYILSDTPDST
ncbi:MAG: Uma2 family endonuclease [Lamprobacter sp.]|uniref:Uma2 family endonuclease n=1 Tax=Lamprobacter sp. TaxID=3100796 RepID=UPI002B25CE6C|nr:Uma2 family endonuclease [Lamprobacter sp.]MEA3640467.1 Uma2 family endonuclease [Lamprobacter sp.]